MPSPKPSDQLMEILFLLASDELSGRYVLSQLSLAFIRIASYKLYGIDDDSMDVKEAWHIIGCAADLAKAEGW